MDPIDRFVGEALRLSEAVLARTPWDVEDARDSLADLAAVLSDNAPGHPAILRLNDYRHAYGQPIPPRLH